MTEILHFEILRKHGQTNTQTDMGITIPRPPPMGGEVTRIVCIRPKGRTQCIFPRSHIAVCMYLYILTKSEFISKL